MNKNAIHNFNLSIKNSASINSSEDLTEAVIKELAKVSKEMSQQKDIVQVWQEQNALNTTITNNSSVLPEGGAIDTSIETIRKTGLSESTISSVFEGTIADHNALTSIISSEKTGTPNALIGGGVADTNGRTIVSSTVSDNTTPPIIGADNNTLNFNNGLTTQTYASVATQQTLTVPQMLQENSSEPTIEVVKAGIKKRLDLAITANNSVEIEYWRGISNAFDEGATAQDFDGKPNDILFTQMYAMLKQSNSLALESQSFNWEIVRKRMIDSIDANILKGYISPKNEERWKTIKKLLYDDKTNVANLFEQYDELFLLLKEIEGLDVLPNTITITTNTKIYPNLSADKLYGAIGKEDVYVFLKGINNDDIQGSAVDKGAVKIKNTEETSFIIGESLEFNLDEKFIRQNLFKKENINWVVYNIQNKKDKGIVFVNEGTSFNYNFDTAGTYRVDAYGQSPTVKGKKSAKGSTFIELQIVAQEIIITPPASCKGGITRASDQEQLFKVALKNSEVKTLNPLKLYYQLETITANKVTKISEEQELDSTGIISLTMPDLGEYKIKVSSKDQYALVQESSVSVIKNEVISIGQTKKASNKGIFLMGNPNDTLTLEAKTFKINPATDEEKENVKWMIYDSNNKPYLPPGTVLLTENKDPQKSYLHKWSSFTMAIPQKEGRYKVEAYSDSKKGARANSVLEIEVRHPQVKEAQWTYVSGDLKKVSGLSGEENHIKASIPGYINQKVIIYFLVDGKRNTTRYITKTNDAGIVNTSIKFDDAFKKQLGLTNKKNSTLQFIVEGEINGKSYAFKRARNKLNDTILINAEKKIVDTYFVYDGNRVTPFTQVPYGAKVTGVVKTLNMVGKEVVLKVYKKNVQHSQLRVKTIVNNEGVATISFVLNKKWHVINPLAGIMDMFYLGMDGFESKLSLENGLNAVVGSGLEQRGNKKEKIDENDPQLIWGAKVSKEFRVKVVQICKNIEKQKGVPFSPNVLMNIIAFETVYSFSPKVGTFKDNPNDEREAGYVGLIQFGRDAAEHLKVKRSELLNMTALEQLDYVEKWFLLKTKDQLKTATDIYLSVNYPVASGKGHLDNEVVYGDPKAAYRANKPFLREADEIDKYGKKVGKKDGKTYVWEIREALEETEKEGEYSKNTILMNNSFNLIMSNPREILNLDTSLTFCYFSAVQIKGIRKAIDKLGNNEDKIKAYRVLQYFVEYNSQRDAKYKSLADTMCNVTSESMALQYLGQMNPAPDPNMKMEDFMMTMIRDILKQGDGARLDVDTRMKIANELGIKGKYEWVGTIFEMNKHKQILEDKLNKGYGVCMSVLGHIVRVVDVNDIGIILDDPYGRIQSFKIRKDKGDRGGYEGGQNSRDNLILKGESNLWTWKQLKDDKIIFKRYEWYYL